MGAKVKPCKARLPRARPARPKGRKPQGDSPQLAALALALADHPAGPGTREHAFHPARKWRFDLAWPGLGVAFECEGGAFLGRRGRHTSGAGFTADCEKYSVAAVLGWRVVRATTAQIAAGLARQWVEAALGVAAGGPVPAGFASKPATRRRRRKI
jgi:hypothetical protein